MYIIDIEASGLDTASYPIEIAYLNLATGESDEFLINPASATGWDYWSEEAEVIHGISRDRLSRWGISLYEAYCRLDALSDKQVFSDATPYDEYWLSRIYEEVGEKPRYLLKDLSSVIATDRREAWQQEMETIARPHRAMADVDVLASLVRKYL